MQRRVACFGDAISDGALELGVEWKHCAKDFAEGGEVIAGDPAAQAQQVSVKHRGRVKDTENVFSRDCGSAIVQLHDDACHALLAKRHQYASSDYGREPRWDTVGENHVER